MYLPLVATVMAQYFKKSTVPELWLRYSRSVRLILFRSDFEKSWSSSDIELKVVRKASTENSSLSMASI